MTQGMKSYRSVPYELDWLTWLANVMDVMKECAKAQCIEGIYGLTWTT